MHGNRFAKPVAVAAGLFLLWAVPGLTRGQSAAGGPGQTTKSASLQAQHKVTSLPPDDFAGLDYSDEQKAEIDQIRRETKAHKDVVMKDDKLTADQKDAMVLGYTRMEYGMVYKVLTPEQKREVRQRIFARRQAEQAAKQKAPPRN